MAATITFSRDEVNLIVELAGCSLDEKPGSNWVQGAGGLPQYICEIARAIHRGGKTVSQAIAIAVSRVKKWATGVGVDTDTQTKAAKAVAEWEALKAKSKAKTGAKKAGKAAMSAGHSEVLCLSDYNLDDVRSAFNNRINEIRREWRKSNPTSGYDDGPPYLYVKEVWNTFLIVTDDYGRDASLHKVPYTVAEAGDITFGEAVEVKTQYIEVSADDLGDTAGDDATLATVAAMTRTNKLTRGHRRPSSALDRVLALAAESAADTADSGSTDTAAPDTAAPDTAADTVAVAVEHADPGHQADGKPRYQVRTPAQIKAAWAMINQSLNGQKYQPWQLAHIKANIQAAAHRRDVDLTTLTAAIDAYPAVGRLLALSAGDIAGSD